PILGLGFGRYQWAAPPYYEAYPAADRRSHAHNNFLQMAAEAGLTGLAAFGLVYATVLRRGAEAIARARDPATWAAAAGAWAGVIGFLVVHFHTARAHALAPLSRGRGARLVVTRRMDYVPAGGPYVRFLYNRAVDAVIAISEGVRAALVRAGVRAERIRVVPSGIDARALAAPPAARAAVRREWGLGDDEVAVVALGALEVRKGHAVLLAAAAGLASAAPRLRYVFCGEGRQATALAGAAAALDGAARLVGFRRGVAACLAAADIVALPSLQEGLGVAALEAMAASRPVVASRVGGLAEAVVHG